MKLRMLRREARALLEEDLGRDGEELRGGDRAVRAEDRRKLPRDVVLQSRVLAREDFRPSRVPVAPREEGRDRHPPVISREFSIMTTRERLCCARRSRAPGPPTADHPLGGPTMSIGGIVLALVITLVGFLSLLRLPIALYPPISPPVVEVSTLFLGANAKIVESAVANAIEEKIKDEIDQVLRPSFG